MCDFKRFLSKGEGVLICTDVNRFYLSGMKSSAGYLLISESGKFLLVDGRYYEAAKKTAYQDVTVLLLNRLSAELNELIAKLNIKKLFTETDITVAELTQLNKVLCCEVVAENSITEDLLYARSIKSESEINNIIAAQRIAEAAYCELLNFIKAGKTEKEIALELDYLMQKKGSEGVSFETIAVSGENSALPHGVPTDKKLKEGEFLTLDFGAVVNGYHSDMTRTVAIGFATDKMKSVYDTVLSAQNAALIKMCDGAACKDVDAAARNIINAAGYGENFNHGTGHGVGLCIHEFPNLSFRSESKLASGQVVTCEPGIYIAGEFGVRIEDMAKVQENSIQNLTNCPKTLIIL